MSAWHERLQDRLCELGWSVAELARRMERDDQTFRDRLYKYVRGDVQNPRGDVLERIAIAVGWSGADLRYGLTKHRFDPHPTPVFIADDAGGGP